MKCCRGRQYRVIVAKPFPREEKFGCGGIACGDDATSFDTAQSTATAISQAV